MNTEKIYTDLMTGYNHPDPMSYYMPPPKGKQLGGCGGHAARHDEEPGMAWWPIVLAVIVAMVCSTGCGQSSGRERMLLDREQFLRDRENEEPTSSVTLFSIAGDTLYHCDSATNVVRTSTCIWADCAGKRISMNGTVVITDN